MELKVFNYHDLKIRTIIKNGEVWFIGKDVAVALGYTKPENAVSTHVDSEDKTTPLIQGSGSNYKSNTVIINESGLYSLILSSKLPSAKQFKRWVTSEVLPSIRKTGGYQSPNAGQEENKTPKIDIRSTIFQYQGQPVLTLLQIANLIRRSKGSVNYQVQTTLEEGKEYFHLSGETMKQFKKENPVFPAYIPELLVVTIFAAHKACHKMGREFPDGKKLKSQPKTLAHFTPDEAKERMMRIYQTLDLLTEEFSHCREEEFAYPLRHTIWLLLSEMILCVYKTGPVFPKGGKEGR